MEVQVVVTQALPQDQPTQKYLLIIVMLMLIIRGMKDIMKAKLVEVQAEAKQVVLQQVMIQEFLQTFQICLLIGVGA
ncbi:MAG: hypothetical protein DRJ03_18240 [Chloroflexi bacterium]|nr:MAG: hypothetical protein DRJ03_18240 [Chloroflexota bacterium]